MARKAKWICPSEYQILAHKYKIIRPDTITEQGDECYGTTDYENNIVSIVAGNDPAVADSVLEVTYWHEAIHNILNGIGEHKLNENEVLIDRLAQCIVQVLHTEKRPRKARAKRKQPNA